MKVLGNFIGVKSVLQSRVLTLKENKTNSILHSYSINPRSLLFDHMAIISAQTTHLQHENRFVESLDPFQPCVPQDHENHQGIEQRTRAIPSLIPQSHCLQVHDLHLQTTKTNFIIPFSTHWIKLMSFVTLDTGTIHGQY
jgi:hypothetical protein